MCAAGNDAVVDKELAAEDEEQNDAGDDLRDVFVEAKVGSDLHTARMPALSRTRRCASSCALSRRSSLPRWAASSTAS